MIIPLQCFVAKTSFDKVTVHTGTHFFDFKLDYIYFISNLKVGLLAILGFKRHGHGRINIIPANPQPPTPTRTKKLLGGDTPR